MAIFSRRTLQRLINENDLFLTQDQSNNHVEKLNEGDLTFEWELVLLNVFSKFGKITHEPKFEKSRREIDILFSSKDDDLEFLADVTCIKGKKDEDNLIISFEQELKKIIDQNKLSGCWHFRVGGNNHEVDFRKSKPKLKLVGKAEFETKIFNLSEFKKFIENVKNLPENKYSYYLRNEEIDLSINYEPRPYHQIYGSHFDDKTIISTFQNSIYGSLRRKYEQLIETGYEKALGIILCDGFGDSFRRKDLLHFGLTDVIYNFLFNHKEISFILTVNAKEKPYSFDREPIILIDFYEGESIDKINNKAINFFKNDLIKGFPKPIRSVWQARNFLAHVKKNPQEIFGGGHFGFSISDSEIKISSRTLLDLLLGNISQKQFLKFYEMNDKDYVYDFLLKELKEGRLISESSIEKSIDEKDDDWIVFKFGEPDAAISPFRVPNSKS
jgi:hypothetical protein